MYPNQNYEDPNQNYGGGGGGVGNNNPNMLKKK